MKEILVIGAGAAGIMAAAAAESRRQNFILFKNDIVGKKMESPVRALQRPTPAAWPISSLTRRGTENSCSVLTSSLRTSIY